MCAPKGGASMNQLRIKLCAIVPVYNHPDKVRDVVISLIRSDLYCLLVDDGSEPICQAILEDLALEFADSIHLIRTPINQGKGHAVCAGMRFAYDQGFSHALQVDADGQHDLGCLPAFMAAMSQYPQAIISGARAYEAMPKSRRSGRKLTDFWVRINTLSRQIVDSMCGYRIYPLSAANSVMSQYAIGRRMDFDTDIIVRLYWFGAPVVHVRTVVSYGEGHPSHFDVFWDNVRISWMHTRLFFGMLPRIPSLLRRPNRQQEVYFS